MFLPTRFSLAESEQSKHSRILVTGSINKAKWWTRFRVQPGEKRQGQRQGWRQGYKTGPKSVWETGPETGLEEETPKHCPGSDQSLT